MANLPHSLFGEPPPSAEETTAPETSTSLPPHPHTRRSNFTVHDMILALNDARTRERALQLLSQNRNKCDNLAVLLWHSFGTMFTLLKEIMQVYHLLSKPDISERTSTRVCNALALLQCVASHPETRVPFINAKIPVYVYPFLNTSFREKPHEYLRLTSLGVIGALVKVADNEVISFLLKNEIIPCCLRCMNVGKELSKTVATFIVQKILMTEEGMLYCCIIADRFFAITRTLETMLGKFSEEPSQRLLQYIIRCYLKLSENPRACLEFGRLVPRMLSDSAFIDLLHHDPNIMSLFQQFLRNVHANRLPVDEYKYVDLRTG